MYKRILLIILISFSVGNIKAQQQRLGAASISTSSTSIGKTYHATDRKNEAARAIEFNEQTVTASNFIANINDYFNIPAKFSFVETESNTDDLGMQHRLMQQYFKGIPLEGLGYRVHEKNGFVTSANGKAILDIDLDINTILSEKHAFDLAVKHLQTKDTTFRSGKKLIVSKNFTYTPESFSIAFQFDIDVSLIERWRISIDARTGQVINKVSLVHTCMAPTAEYDTATGLTNYHGTRTIRVEKLESGSSRLEGQTEHGGEIGTYDFGNTSIWALIFGDYDVDGFYSSDNTFDDPYEQPAVSVHWATEQAYEYYFNKHNRNSYDNDSATIISYVHVDEDWDNAAWVGDLLIYGDGSNNNPPVELDVVSHEFTHGVTQYEADLTYQFEPGALSESFSDIFAKAVEFETLGNAATWQLGRHFRDGGLRDMSNPNLKNQPDTYYGDMWYDGYEDNGGVHINSGVQNFWFYLLCEGGSGVNDREVSYDVKAIGMDTATNIAYRNLTEYLMPSSDYLDSRIGSLLATADLYGDSSSVYQQVDEAWDAVGVIDEPIITNFDLYDITATTVKLRGTLLPRGDTVTYHFEYGINQDFEDSTSIFEYTDVVEGKITGLQSETKYYVRLVATNENGTSYATTEFTTISLAPLVEIQHTVDVTDTSATLYGEVNPNNLPTSFYFEYGPTPAMDSVTTSYPLSDTTEFLNVSAPVTGLQPRETYYYKLIATNDSASTSTDSLTLFTALKPVISSFTPVTATPGTEITITGQYFNSATEKNRVRFGATEGTVLSSSSTEIKVEVPDGASFGPITLIDTESGKATESVQEFVPTFSDEFGEEDFQLRAAFNEFTIYEMEVRDMDGDGRPDIVASYYKGITIFQNVNTGGGITNESFVRSNIPLNENFRIISLADIDRNGLQDIIGYYQGAVRIYPNYSAPGYIFFGAPIDVQIDYWSYMQVKDFDNDGYVDLAGRQVLSGDSCLFSVFRNISPKGALSSNSFEQRYSKILPYNYIRYMATEDLNNDGTPDVMVSSLGEDNFSVLENKSYPGTFEFEEIVVQDSTRTKYAKYIAQDLNQDGWKDVTSLSTSEAGKMSNFENKRSGITLSKPIVALDGHADYSVQPGDIDGDGKVDLLVGDKDGRYIFLKNKMEVGEHFSGSSFTLFKHYGINDNNKEVESEVILNDLNGDGRPEVINSRGYSFYPYEGHQLEIWQNAPNDCLDPSLISVEDVSRSSATIVLPPNTTLDEFEIEYAYAGSTNWRRVYYSTDLSYLNSGTTYQLRARAKCYLGFTSYAYTEFTTECVYLETFSISDVQVNDVTLSASGSLSYFEVQYSEAGKDEWKEVYRYDDQITDLLPGTAYDLRYRGRCDTPAEFNYTQFTTLCPALSTITIDKLSYNKAVASWTTSYEGDAILEYSADSVAWALIDETRTMFPLIPGKEYFVRGALACTDTSSNFIYTSFTTPCPSVSKLTIDSVTPFSAKVNWVDKSATGSYTIRYSTPTGDVKTEVGNSTSFYLDDLSPGTEYTVSVAPECISEQDFASTTFTTVCYAPFNLSAEAITYTTAELSWDSDFSGPPYSIDYSIVGSGVWSTTESASTMISLEELRPGTEYEARVHINCLSETAPYASVRFETSLYEETVFGPNPTDNIIKIYPSKNVIGNRFGIYNNTGKKINGGELLGYTFDLSGFSAGIYILKIDGEKPMKIIKQ